jgi:hypothetical protein
MCRRSCETGRFTAPFTLRSDEESTEHLFCKCGIDSGGISVILCTRSSAFVSELQNHFGGLFRSLKSAFGA